MTVSTTLETLSVSSGGDHGNRCSGRCGLSLQASQRDRARITTQTVLILSYRLALCIQHSLSKLSASEDFNRAATVDVDCNECSRGIDKEQDS